jgi:hypothetical protein
VVSGSIDAHGQVGDPPARPRRPLPRQGASLELEGLPRADPWPLPAVQAALGGYEDRRLAQAGRVQRTARVWGEIWHVDGVAMALRDEAFRLRAPHDLSRIDWLYQDSVA